jgi:hypothetical protein
MRDKEESDKKGKITHVQRGKTEQQIGRLHKGKTEKGRAERKVQKQQAILCVPEREDKMQDICGPIK